jgi:hypothetical protein
MEYRRAREGRPKVMRRKISLSCLRVERATKFFKSRVERARALEMMMTHEESRAKGSITEAVRTPHILHSLNPDEV